MKRSLFVFWCCFLPSLLCAQTEVAVRPVESGAAARPFRVNPSTPPGRPKVGIVLSGGGARGISQIGVLRVLEQHRIPIDVIVGTSLGSVVGGAYASGYSVAELESIAVTTNWEEVLSFSEGTKRRDLFIEEKQLDKTGFLVIRFDGMQPIIPSAISGGQRLNNFFMNLTFQALYHPTPGFDGLKIPFRAVATDLYHGKQVVLESGSLAEAMRASVTVPLLYSPLVRDSMALVDGGLMSNIPVDVARALGCDIVIVVNCTGTLRHEAQLGAPWEVADQIMTIMMQSNNLAQLKLADAVISPELGGRIASDFSNVDTLIEAGAQAAEQAIVTIKRLLDARKENPALLSEEPFGALRVLFEGDPLPAALTEEITAAAGSAGLSLATIEQYVDRAAATGLYDRVYADILHEKEGQVVRYHAAFKRRIREVWFSGNERIESDTIRRLVGGLEGKIIDRAEIHAALESVVRLYREKKYSLARIDSLTIDSLTGSVRFVVNEGRLTDIKVEGNTTTRDYVVRREFPLEANDVFNLDRMYEGLVNLASTGLFEYLLVDVRYEGMQPHVVLKVHEKSAELLRLGLHADNERGFVSTISIRDENFRGAGDDIGLRLRYGLRDRVAALGYRSLRIFKTYLTFGLTGYYEARDINTYRDDPNKGPDEWERIENGEYRQAKSGGTFTFGSQFERFGNVTAELRAERHKIEPVSGAGYTPESYKFVSLRLQSTLDTENKFSFPTEGIVLNLSYETASQKLGSDVAFSKFSMMYESYLTILRQHTFRPRVMLGFADETLPLAEQYSLGGQPMFMGLREDDSRGRQLFVVSMEYRYWLPFRVIFETFLRVRYDAGMISTVPEELKFSTFRHGIGAEIALDTPIGPISFGAGKSFYVLQGLPESRLKTGPLLWYFTVGPDL